MTEIPEADKKVLADIQEIKKLALKIKEIGSYPKEWDEKFIEIDM